MLHHTTDKKENYMSDNGRNERCPLGLNPNINSLAPHIHTQLQTQETQT
jgi:hypothetical protein